MHRCRRLAFLLLLWTTTSAFASVLDFGRVAAQFPINAQRVVADPARNRVYALVTASGSVTVIDTTTLKITATIPTGPNPTDMALSLDGTTLYVANRGGASQAVAALDLNTLQVSRFYILPGPATAIAAGLDGRIYVTLTVNYSQAIYQFDRDTGVAQNAFGPFASGGLLKISADGKTLFAASVGTSPSSVTAYDVSTATPKATQSTGNAGGNGEQLAVSHTGKFLCFADGGGNDGSHGTYLYSATDLSKHFGTFKDLDSVYPEALDFSPDDSLVYEVFTSGDSVVLDAFNTQNFSLVVEAPLPVLPSGYANASVVSAAVDHTGSYFFVTESDYNSGAAQVLAIATGAGPLTPTAFVPEVHVPATYVYATVGVPFRYQIFASNSPTHYAATDLPVGLSLDETTGVVTGVPTGEQVGDSTILSASNAAGTGTGAPIYFEIYSQPQVSQITSSALGYAEVGGFFYYQVTANYGPKSFAAAQLPAGLKFDAATGVISGVTNQTGVYVIALFASNDAGVGVGQLTLYVYADGRLAPRIVDAPATATGVVGEAFHYQFTATNRRSYSAFDLPDGLTFDHHTGTISGTPTTAGRYTVRIAAGNYWGVDNGTVTVRVIESTTPVITSATAAAAQAEAPFRYRISATGSNLIYSATGLPAGLTLNPVKGIIKGTPAVAGYYAIGLSATDGTGTGTATLTLPVGPALAPVPVILATVAIPSVTLGSGSYGEILLTRQGPITSDITVRYALTGNAVNGTDYAFLKGTAKIKAGKTSKTIKIAPFGNLGGATSKSVSFKVLDGADYATPVRSPITVKIVTGP